MKKKINNQEAQLTQVYNVVILDRSGSMNSIRRAAVEGFNETLAGIKKAQEKYADTQKHFVTLLTFCDCEKRYVFDKMPVAEASPLRMEDYEPCCCTPLYDAMGLTLTDMHKHVKGLKDSLVVVTVITDGLENASKEYSGKAVKELVEQLKKEGWTFTYMGANQDSVEVAFTLSIRNARNFDYSAEGTMEAMDKDCRTRMCLFERVHKFHAKIPLDATSDEERNQRYAAMADDAFDETV